MGEEDIPLYPVSYRALFSILPNSYPHPKCANALGMVDVAHLVGMRQTSTFGLALSPPSGSGGCHWLGCLPVALCLKGAFPMVRVATRATSDFQEPLSAPYHIAMHERAFIRQKQNQNILPARLPIPIHLICFFYPPVFLSPDSVRRSLLRT